jgi:hypothetical protein
LPVSSPSGIHRRLLNCVVARADNIGRGAATELEEADGFPETPAIPGGYFAFRFSHAKHVRQYAGALEQHLGLAAGSIIPALSNESAIAVTGLSVAEVQGIDWNVPDFSMFVIYPEVDTRVEVVCASLDSCFVAYPALRSTYGPAMSDAVPECPDGRGPPVAAGRHACLTWFTIQYCGPCRQATVATGA